MKTYTEDEALQEIFSQKGDQLTANMAVYKSRYRKGILSQRTIDKILIKYNFVIMQPTMYQLIPEKHVRNRKSSILTIKG